MDIVTYALSKKLVNGIQSGLASATVDNDNCSITFNWTNGTSSTLTFPKPSDGVSITNAEIVSDELILSFSDSSTINVGNVKGDKGDTGDKGEKGDKGEQGIQGEKGEDGVNPTIEIATQSDTEYTLKLTDADGSIITPNLQGIGSAIFVGNEITSKQSSIVVEITDSHIGDMYINVDTSDYYIRDDANSINNSWCYKGNLQGIQGMNNYELAVKNGFIGTEQDYLDSLVGEANDTHIVSSKPNIADDTTELKTWYYYQIDGSGTGTAWKYKMYLPTTADLTAGKYAVYYSMKPYRGEFTVDTPAMTDKDTYRYYVIMDLNAITTTIYKESIADGTTEVLETVQCEQKEPTDEYIIIDEPMEQLGQWVQTLYIGSTKEDASEVTLTTGTSVTGFITTLTFEEIVGNRSNLLTADKTSIVNAINEHDKLLRNSNADVLNTTSKNIVGAINELESKHYLDVFNLQGGSVLDYAKTFEALTHNYFYANNCSDLPNNMNYGYCSVDVSQDPLYRDITFYCPTTGRFYVNTIGASEDDNTIFGEWSGWHEFLMKKDIVTTLDDTVTDNQIPSAKEVYDNCIKDNNLKTYTSIEQLGLTTPTTVGAIYNAIPANSCLNIFASLSSVTDLPLQQGLLSITKISTAGFDIIFKRSGSGSISNNAMYIGQLKGVDGTGLTWKRVCTTSVADVPFTDITSKLTNCSAKFIGYSVKDGICRVKINGLKPNTQAVEILATGILPNQDPIHNGHFNVMYTTGNMALFVIYNSSTDGVRLHSCNSTISGEIYCTLEYPVAES